jgi:hypothetical protein
VVGTSVAERAARCGGGGAATSPAYGCANGAPNRWRQRSRVVAVGTLVAERDDRGTATLLTGGSELR